MRKRLLMLLLAGIMAFSATACADNDRGRSRASREDRDDDDDDEDEDDEDDEDEEETETEEVTEEETEEETETETETETEEEKGDWLEEHGITLSLVGKFTFTTMMNDKTKDTDEMTVPATISITEEELPSSPGYKNVKAVFTYDLTEAVQSGVLADGVFDRYTGIALEFSEETQEEMSKLYPGDADHFVRITNGDTHYDIYKESKLETELPTMTKTFEIICPEDYDGLVFYSGYDSLALEEPYDALDIGSRFYTFDELPYYDNGHDYYYFSYDKEAAAKAGATSAASSAGKKDDNGGGNGKTGGSHAFGNGSSGGSSGGSGGGGQSGSSGQSGGNSQSGGGQTGGSGQTGGAKKSYTADDIVELARIHSGAPEASLDSVDSDGTLNIQLYEIGQYNDTTLNWYYINPKTLKGTDLFGSDVDLNSVAR